MDRSLSVGEIFRLFGQGYIARHGQSMPVHQHRAIGALKVCRTAYLGGQVLQCDSCAEQWYVYRSCRNRHCPTCQGMATIKWLATQEAALLPVPYFQVVFTIPNALYAIALRNQRVVYDILFQAASETLLELARDPKHLGADIGITAVLHTWNQKLLDHPHLHCLVPSGGLSPCGKRWIPTRSAFFLHWEVIANVFRGKFLDYLKRAYAKGKLVFPGKIAHLRDTRAFTAYLKPLYHKGWVVHIVKPKGGPGPVLSYLGRYIHRVALSNDRIVSITDDQVIITYSDRKNGGKQKPLKLTPDEFIRRFLMHILPHRFPKIRHYGLLSNRQKKGKFARALMLIRKQGFARKFETTWQDRLKELTGEKATRCPVCGKGQVLVVQTLLPKAIRAPPPETEQHA